MSDGVTPVLRQVVVTARHSWPSGVRPVRSWRRSTRVTVLRASSCSRCVVLKSVEVHLCLGRLWLADRVF